ncbi:MAG: phenylalanine 4-monooxygenase [Myxococcota bacterium]
MTQSPDAPLVDENDLVKLDRDHPGFRDPVYRRRRNEIARMAAAYRSGDPLPDVAYTDDERMVWRTALEHLRPLHERHACAQFLRGWPRLGFEPGHVPQLSEVSAVLQRETGFRLIPVAGLVTPRVFLSHLARGEFMATQYMRHHSAPMYTPEPDVIHELVGHAATLADPQFAETNRLFGEATLHADEATALRLIRVYWYALEFGVARREGGGLEVVGAGLLSSFGELGRYQEARREEFDLERVFEVDFDPTQYQGTLFEARSTNWLLGELNTWLRGLIRG